MGYEREQRDAGDDGHVSPELGTRAPEAIFAANEAGNCCEGDGVNQIVVSVVTSEIATGSRTATSCGEGGAMTCSNKGVGFLHL